MVNWLSQESYLMINPRHPLAGEIRLNQLPCLPAHIWLATSGTTGDLGTLKLVALSKQAFLASAAAVNQHLQSTARDVWIKVLPDFHVGGLSIYARAHLSDAKVIDVKGKWDVLKLKEVMEDQKGMIVSLVPTQVHDLVTNRCQAPIGHLRSVIVGGDVLSEHLYGEARKLGWPLFTTYGCTECCSQIAAGGMLLPHISARTDTEGFLQFRGPSLFTGYAFWKNGKAEWSDPKVDGWWTSDDRGEIQNGSLKFLGRRQDFIKVGGEGVNLYRLNNLLQKICGEIHWKGEAVLIGTPDVRLGQQVQLVVSPETVEHESLVTRFNESVMPFERIRTISTVTQIPRTPLGKPIDFERVFRV